MEAYMIATIYVVGCFLSFLVLMFTTENFKDKDDTGFYVWITLFSWLGISLFVLWWLDEDHKNN
jgi:hypothetical protein